LKRLLIGALLAAALSAPACAAELVSNGGFESVPFTGWSHTFNNLVGPISISDVHSGTQAALFGSSEGFSDTLSQTLATVAGQTYTLTFWIGSNLVLPNAPVNAHFEAALDGVWFAWTNASDFTYDLYTANFVAASNATVISFTAFNDTGYYLLDDVSVIGQRGDYGVGVDLPGGGVPEPTSWALMILGVGMAGFCLRRQRWPTDVSLPA
jgi:opacity protein-like surface antigen